MITQGMIISGRYEVIGKIGAGGMSDVYKAKDHTLERFVAIKVLKAEFSEDINFVTKFRTEASSAAGLEHPNIVNIYDVGSETEFHYIVMEYIEGITLKTYIEKKGQLTFKEAVSIAIQVGRGIEAAHNKNIIHRDIKPQNIIISTEGKVKVTDFGIAKAATANTISSDVMGSVHYSSPEQARNGFVDGKSDIYSLGIVMYEMVTGRVPFDGDTTVAVAIQHLQEEMAAPSIYAKDLPISMEKIILKCTQKSPDRRYASMTALLSDLRKSLLNPDEDFVVIAPISQDKTRIIGMDEVNKIKQETGGIHVDEAALVARALSEEKEEQEDEEEFEDEDDAENPLIDKIITMVGVGVGIVIVLLIIIILSNFIGDFDSGNTGSNTNIQQQQQGSASTQSQAQTGIKLESLEGYTVAEAKTILNQNGLGIKKAGSIPSEEYAEGQIISHTPEAGTMVAPNTTIEVIVSSGPEVLTIPSVLNSDENTAYNKLFNEGFTPVKEFAYNDDIPQGYVISQTPNANVSGSKGDTVTIVISRGPETVPVTLIAVPDLSNNSEEAAKQALISAGLSVGEVKTQYHNTIQTGNVISQDILAGTQVEPNRVVNIVVSLGEEPAQEIVTQTYYIKLTINKPNNDTVAAANIYLLSGADGEGNILEQWTNQEIALFAEEGLHIEKEGMLSSKGSLKIEWLDAGGNVIGDPQIQNLEFKKSER